MTLRRTTLTSAALALLTAATLITPTTAEASSSHAYEAMPNFVGMGRSSVYAEMYDEQLYFKTQGLGANSSRWNRVVGELPAAGTQIQAFSTVTLIVTTVPVVVTSAQRVAPVHQRAPAHHVTAVRHVATKATIKVVSITRTGVKVIRRSTTRTARPALDDFKVGVATWYSYIPGQCATWYLPKGVRINVEDLDNGRVISCVVTDREAAHGNRAVDLSETQFAELAPLGVGVVPVRVTW